MSNLITKANEIYQLNFTPETWFERAIFFSWGCSIGDCTFCYMSTQPKEKALQESRRSFGSIYAETIISKLLGWEIGFFTGGIGSFTPVEIETMLKTIHQIIEKKLWLSIGPVSKHMLMKYKPYIKGVVGSTETINPELHKKVCPSKPLEPYEKMFLAAQDLNLETAMTFIIGMGETRNDFLLLKEFIIKYNISKIHLYGLIPTKGTVFENSEAPSAEEQAWWIANLRIEFPKLDIQCGIWKDRADRIPILLKAGANSISKFPAIRYFDKEYARNIEDACFEAGRSFKGTLTSLEKLDLQENFIEECNKIIVRLELQDEIKKSIKEKLEIYLKQMGVFKCLMQIKQ